VTLTSAVFLPDHLVGWMADCGR